VGLHGRQYILSSGIWYEVVDEFLKRVNEAISRIEAPKLSLPAWDQKEREADYNRRCGAKPGFLHFDAKNIMYGGGQSKFEFCDVFHPKEKALIFAKIVTRSSGMSHLVEQVRRTSELLFGADDSYRQSLRDVFKKYHPKADSGWLQQRPRQGDWNLCLVSLGLSAEDLPFFAKSSLVKLHKDLRERGHNVFFGKV
jgi:uncharacterized protein (TIGR04141 family)